MQTAMDGLQYLTTAKHCRKQVIVQNLQGRTAHAMTSMSAETACLFVAGALPARSRQ